MFPTSCPSTAPPERERETTTERLEQIDDNNSPARPPTLAVALWPDLAPETRKWAGHHRPPDHHRRPRRPLRRPGKFGRRWPASVARRGNLVVDLWLPGGVFGDAPGGGGRGGGFSPGRDGRARARKSLIGCPTRTTTTCAAVGAAAAAAAGVCVAPTSAVRRLPADLTTNVTPAAWPPN